MLETQPLKIIFAGTPEFAAQALQALLHSHHQIIAVYTQPDRPAGRGRHLTASPVKQLAQSYLQDASSQHHFSIHQPASLKSIEEQNILRDLQADVMVVAAYGLILPEAILQAPRYGCINIHASLLPRWRGAAPIQRAILAGDSETGITIMQMDKGLDTGAMLLKSAVPIRSDDTSGTLHDRLAEVGAEALLITLDSLATKQAHASAQDNSQATYAEKISKDEARIDWHDTAENLSRKVRAFNPWPVAFASLQGENVRIWEATYNPESSHNKTPGTIVGVSNQSVDVATGLGVLQVTKLQLPGGKVISSQDVFNSYQHRFGVGTQLG